MTVSLEHGQFKLDIAPELGGAVTRFSFGERNILRRALAVDNVLNTSAFPMVPFSGRIANGRFSANGGEVNLPPNMPPEPHAIHGFGWQSPWTVERKGADFAVLTQKNPSPHWPWDYTATQRFQLTETGLDLELSVENHNETPMPAGLGWHPYFEREGAFLSADTTAIWLSGDDMIPAPPVAVWTETDLRHSHRVDDLHLDYAFDIGAPVQTVAWPDMTLTQTTDPIFQKMIVYVPKGEDFFCVEPATHAPDAVNASLGDDVTGLKWLAKDEVLSGTIRLRVEISDALYLER